MTEQVGRAGAVYNVAIGAVAQLFSVVEVLKVQVHTYRFRYTFVNNLHHFSTLCAASSLSFFCCVIREMLFFCTTALTPAIDVWYDNTRSIIATVSSI